MKIQNFFPDYLSNHNEGGVFDICLTGFKALNKNLWRDFEIYFPLWG